LLFAFILLHGRGVPANLLSIGAIDFGIIIDGTVVMMENIYRELAARHGQEYKLSEVILAAARDVDRPIFYSVAVILAGYIPIYALTGPSGKLFLPMAETISYALLDSLIFTLTLVPVLASYWFTHGIKEKTNRAYEWFRSEYEAELNWCLDNPILTMVLATLIFGASLLLIPYIGGEFMPHLDEGAVWVRATMPYTISFEEAAKFAPQIRNILMSYPQVTEVGSELARPDDGTDPTGFFNCEFYIGLRPYKDKIWGQGPIHSKAELTEDLLKKLAAYPGVIFNRTHRLFDLAPIPGALLPRLREAPIDAEPGLGMAQTHPAASKARQKCARDDPELRTSFSNLVIYLKVGDKVPPPINALRCRRFLSNLPQRPDLFRIRFRVPQENLERFPSEGFSNWQVGVNFTQ
jgi:cobalt-zinc-cadmium resistance protein CzcA